MNLIIEDIIRVVFDFAEEYEEIVSAYLFGSAARRALRTESDIDISIVTTRKIMVMKKINWETELSNRFKKDVDLVVFGQAELLLQHQILKYGKLIYEKNSRERVKQETASRRHYLDTRFLYKELSV